ncbi:MULTISPECIES: MotE family protein [Cohaesibacter]|uniref:MotE family protein n=1 Tax=Cohaesibacter TaxID=655352 RepID=UPI000DE9F3E2|nr:MULTISPECIES: hypothetical protein [Cohaesibacter]TLP48537.1 hypothetical protein FDK21_02430 [Cohaesibacter sp. CAU 1516]
MTNLRLLPTLLVAVTGLLFIKVTHLVFNSDMLFVSTAPALAQETQPGQQAAPAETPADAPANTNGAANTEEPTSLIEGMKVDPSESSRSELAILERLSERREELDERAKSIEMREALLNAAEKRLEKRVDELKALEASIKQATSKRNQEQEEDLGKLVAMYQSMKPKQAAQIFEVLEPGVLLEIVKMMNPRKVAAIMGQMRADAAGALSLAIAKGNTLEQDVKNLESNTLPQIGN